MENLKIYIAIGLGVLVLVGAIVSVPLLLRSSFLSGQIDFGGNFPEVNNLGGAGENNSAGSATTPKENFAGETGSDGRFFKVPEEELLQGCPFKDCIPSIDDPKFETVDEADKWLNDDDLVFGIEINGDARVYSQRILNWHEIVNDTVGGQEVAVTFCPLCGSAIAFNRVVDGMEYTFGVSGLLHNSDLVMYDREEDNYWQQLTGEAIVGEAAREDKVLEVLPMSIVSWETWKEEHPDSKVLSRDTGEIRDYSRYPYGTYEENGEIWFGVENEDARLHPKDVVYGFTKGDVSKAYTEEALLRELTINDTFGEDQVVVTYSQDGTVILKINATGEELVPIRNFWFAWAAFNPDTGLYE